MPPSRQSKFVLAEHPHCCLCGGARLATTVEHCPPMVIFTHPAQYPREADHRFPSCTVCQERSKGHDLFFAWIMYSAFSAGQMAGEYDRYKKIHQGIMNNMPEKIEQLRKLLPVQLTSKGYPILPTKTGPAADAIRSMAWKLFATCHYKHTGKILNSHYGLIAFNARMNLADFDWDRMEEFRLLSWAPKLTSADRTKGETTDRFVYRHLPHPNPVINGFSHLLVPFSLIHGFTVSDYRLLTESEIGLLRFADYILRPLPAGPRDFPLLRFSAGTGRR